MSIRKASLAPGEYYHLYNRGNSKQRIFHDKADHERFIGLLYVCNTQESFKIDDVSKKKNLLDLTISQKPLVSLGAYTLMPNHFHLLVTADENGAISRYMQKLSTAFVMYYNKKYQRTGGLFEGKFKSQHLDTDRYLKYIFSYIHLNVLKLKYKDWKKEGIKNKNEAFGFLYNYKYSSYLDFVQNEEHKRLQSKILHMQAFPKYFSNKKIFTQEIFDWLSFNESR